MNMARARERKDARLHWREGQPSKGKDPPRKLGGSPGTGIKGREGVLGLRPGWLPRGTGSFDSVAQLLRPFPNVHLLC